MEICIKNRSYLNFFSSLIIDQSKVPPELVFNPETLSIKYIENLMKYLKDGNSTPLPVLLNVTFFNYRF